MLGEAVSEGSLMSMLWMYLQLSPRLQGVPRRYCREIADDRDVGWCWRWQVEVCMYFPVDRNLLHTRAPSMGWVGLSMASRGW